MVGLLANSYAGTYPDFISMYYMRRLEANENVPRFSRIEAKEQSCTRYEAREGERIKQWRNALCKSLG